jgi:hypothetical protein
MTSSVWPSAVWLFVAATALHNLEEAIWLPSWRGFRRLAWGVARVDSFVFGFAAGCLTILFVLFGALAISAGPDSFWAYMICGCALGMALNAFAPHLAVSAWTRSYAPGTGTAILLVLPASAFLLTVSIRENYVDLSLLALTGPSTVLGLLVSVLLLFHLGRALWKGRS